MASGSLWNYHIYEISDDENENDNNGNKINNNKTKASKSFRYKTAIVGNTSDNASRLNAESVVPLNCLSNFVRYLDFPLINRDIEIDLRLERDCTSRTFRVVDLKAGPDVY